MEEKKESNKQEIDGYVYETIDVYKTSSSTNENQLNEVLNKDYVVYEKEIFYDEDKRVEKKKSNFLKSFMIFIIVTALIVLVGLLSVFFIASKYSSNGDPKNNPVTNYANNIAINIDGPKEIDSYVDGAKYKITFKNTEQFKLTDAEVLINFPENFYFVSATKEPSFKSRKYAKFNFSDIEKDSSVDFEIIGNIYGKLDSVSTLNVSLDYKIYGVSSNFASKIPFEYKIVKPAYSISFDYPDKVYYNTPFDYEVKIKNNSNFDLSNFGLNFDYSYGFEIVSSDEKPFADYKGDHAVYIFDIAKNNGMTDQNGYGYYEKIIKINGVIKDDKSSKIPFKITSGMLDDSNSLDTLNVVDEQETAVNLSNFGLTFNFEKNFEVDDSSDIKTSIININDPLNFNFSYKKDDKELSFKNLRLVLEFIGDDIIDQNLKSKYIPKISSEIKDSMSNLIFEFNKNNVSGFSDVDSEKTGNLDISFNFRNVVKDNLKNSNLNTILKMSLYGLKGDSSEESLLINFPSIKFIVDSNLKIVNQIRYYDTNGSTIGFGPIPPKINEQTKYQAYFNFDNFYNKLTKFKVEATLPVYVDFSDQYTLSDASSIIYDKSSRKISYTVNSFDIYNNNFAKFFIYFNPKDSGLGKSWDLLQNIALSYHDEFLNKDITKNLPNMTTDIVGVKGSGVVGK